MISFLASFQNSDLMYLWLTVFIITLIIEIGTTELVSIWFSLSALVCILLAFLGVPWYIQLILFAVLSIVLLITLRYIVKRKLNTPAIATNLDTLINQEITLLKECSPTVPGEGKVRDVIWSVFPLSNETFVVGETAIIQKIEGSHLIIRKKEKTNE